MDGMLAGMADSLTNHLAWRSGSTMPCVIKYVPYGALVEVCTCVYSRIQFNNILRRGQGATLSRSTGNRE